MLEYKRIDIAEGIDNHKTDGSCECIIFNNWCFLIIKILDFNKKYVMVVMI